MDPGIPARSRLPRRLRLWQLHQRGRLLDVRRRVLGAYKRRVLEGMASFVWLQECLGRGVHGMLHLRLHMRLRACDWFLCRVGWRGGLAPR